MKAKVYFHAPDGSGNFEVYEPGTDFEEWVQQVGEVSASTRGFGYFIGKVSIPLRYFTRIEKLED